MGEKGTKRGVGEERMFHKQHLSLHREERGKMKEIFVRLMRYNLDAHTWNNGKEITNNTQIHNPMTRQRTSTGLQLLTPALQSTVQNSKYNHCFFSTNTSLASSCGSCVCHSLLSGKCPTNSRSESVPAPPIPPVAVPFITVPVVIGSKNGMFLSRRHFRGHLIPKSSGRYMVHSYSVSGDSLVSGDDDVVVTQSTCTPFAFDAEEDMVDFRLVMREPGCV